MQRLFKNLPIIYKRKGNITSLVSCLLQNKRFQSDVTHHGGGLGTIFATDGEKKQSSMNFEIINESTDSILFGGYSPSGFQLSNGTRIIGPCVSFPKTILFWNVRSAEDIDESSLSLFTALEPKLDCLIIGKGNSSVKMDVVKVKQHMSKFNINVEVLPSIQAIGMFNFLNSDDRYVAAALIPPDYEDMYADEKEEIMRMRQQRTELIRDEGFGEEIDIEHMSMPMFPSLGPGETGSKEKK